LSGALEPDYAHSLAERGNVVIVRCRADEISLRVELHSKNQEMKCPSLNIGQNYLVYGINFHNGDENFFPHISYLIEIDGYTIGSINRSFFDVIDNKIPSGWIFNSGKSVSSIYDKLFDRKYFEEDLLDDKGNSRELFDNLRRTLIDFHNL
jgi:hypothetical protein